MSHDRTTEGMGVVVRTVARWLKGFVLLYGISIVLYGHVTPGGGFAGGVVIAAAFIMLVLAQGERQGLSYFPTSAASTLDSVGVLVFLGVGLAGMLWIGGTLFENFIATPEHARFELLSAGLIPISNVGLGLKVASSLFLVFAVLAALRPGDESGDDS